jgi:hypothetical protein
MNDHEKSKPNRCQIETTDQQPASPALTRTNRNFNPSGIREFTFLSSAGVLMATTSEVMDGR